MERVLNWKPSPKDERDFKFNLNFSLFSMEELPRSVDLSSVIPEVWDQKNLGSCVGHGTGMSVLYQSKVQSRPIDPSRLFLYYNARASQGWQNDDSGCYIRDAFKSLNKEGVCKETTWPYLEEKVFEKPTDFAYTESLETVSTKYHSVNNSLLELKNCIAQNRPIVFGFVVYSSFMYGSWIDTMPMSKNNERNLGGHCVIAIGYDDNRKAFKIRNSWGKNWKDNGNFWMPYEFITSNECDDFWVLESLKDISIPKPEPVPNGCLDAFNLFNSLKELKTFSRSFLLKLVTQLGLSPNKTSKDALLLLLKTNLKL